MARVGELTVDLATLVNNWRSLKANVNPISAGGGCEVSAVVKADAYGLGVGPVARALYQEGCRTFFVANISEALELSQELPEERVIYTLQGFDFGQELEFAHHDIRPVIISLAMLERWLKCGFTGNPACAIKVNSGMNRLGLDERDFLDFLGRHSGKRIDSNVSLILSHLACADEPSNQMNRSQLKRFERIVEQCRRVKAFESTRFSLANSAGCFLGEEYLFDMVRVGIAMYSGTLGDKQTPNALSLSCPVSLDLPILQTRRISVGESVGYGGSYLIKQDTVIATVGGGYSDGLFRNMEGKAVVYYDGRTVPVVGRVSMDSFAVDLGLLDESSLSKVLHVSVFHSASSLIALAQACKTITYELLTSLGLRYKRRYVSPLGEANVG